MSGWNRASLVNTFTFTSLYGQDLTLQSTEVPLTIYGADSSTPVFTVNGDGDLTIAGDLSIGGSFAIATLTVDDGSAASPSISFTADTDTGFYRVGPGNIGVTSNTDNIAQFDSDGLNIISGTSSTTTGTGALRITGGVGISENVNIGGDLTVSGTTTTIDTTQLLVSDAFIGIANGNNTTDTIDIGIWMQYNSGAGVRYAGLYRDNSDGNIFKLFNESTDDMAGGASTITTGNLADLCVNTICVENGTFALPSFTFMSDDTMGLYYIGTDRMGVAVSADPVVSFGDHYMALEPYGAAAGNVSELRFKEPATVPAASANYVGFKSADTLAGNVIWTLPIADGGSGEVLSTNGSGILSWTSAGGASTLQDAYDGGSSPHITTSDADGAVDFKRGTTGGDTDDVFRVLNNAGSTVANITGEGKAYFGSGTDALPSISFTGDTNTGLYNTADLVGVSTGGISRTTFSSAGVTSAVSFLAPNGTAGAPAYSFSADTDMGIYRAVIGDVTAFCTAIDGTLCLTLGRDSVTTEIFAELGGGLELMNGGTLSADFIDTESTTILSIGAAIATKVEVADTSVITEIQGPLTVLAGAASIDTFAAGTLTLGPATATKVEIADAAVTTEIQGPLTVLAGAASIDTTAAGTLSIGPSTATKLEIGDTGVITEIQGTLDVVGQVKIPTGVVATPGLVFNDTSDNTGIYGSDSAFNVGIAGTLKLSITGSAATFSDEIVGIAGGAPTTPSFVFAGDLTTGMYRSAAGTTAFASAGSLAASVNSSAFTVNSTASVFNSEYLSLPPHNTGAGDTQEIRMAELVANGSLYVGFKAPDQVTSTTVWSLPPADGSSGQVLSTNASGALSWVNNGAGAGDILNGGQAGAISVGTNDATNMSLLYNTAAKITLDGTSVTAADPIYLPDGAVGAPALTFTNDTDVGLYYTATALNIAISGNQEASFTATGLATDSVDALTATTLLLGAATATKVEIADTGVVTEVQGNLTVEADIDTITATTLLLGSTTATKVEIADTGVVTEVQGSLNVEAAIDTITATTLTVGPSTATKVELADTGVQTEAQGPFKMTQSTILGLVEDAGTSITLGTDDNVVVSTADNNVTVTLPTLAAANHGTRYIIIKEGTTVSGNLTVSTDGSDTIDDGSSTTIVLTDQYDRVEILASTNNWYTI